ALLSISAVAPTLETVTLTPAATPAPPPIASVAEMIRRRYWFDASTRTDWPLFGVPAVPSLTSVFFPIVAFVVTVGTLTVPDTPTPALPPTDASTPTAAMLSLLVAVTATPRKPALEPCEAVFGP